MKKLFAIIYHERNFCDRKHKEILNTAYAFEKILHDPTIEVDGFIRFETQGNTYQERQQSIRTLAENFSIMRQAASLNDFTADGLINVGNFFKKYGTQYGLVKELQTNALMQ